MRDLWEEVGCEYIDCDSFGTVIHTSVDGKYAGYIIISDKIKDDSKSAIAALKSAGIKHGYTFGRQKPLRKK